MSSATIHLVVPTLLVLATGLFPRKAVLLWAPLTVFNDFDFIFNFFGYYVLGTEVLLHRAIFHNVFVGIPTAALAVWLWHRMLSRDPELRWASWRDRWTAFGHVPFGHAAVLATVYLESHVFLDMFQGGVTPLWPLVNVYVYPRFFIWVNTQTGEPSLEANVESGTGAPELSPLYPWLTPEHLGILILCLVAALVAVVAESRRAVTPRIVTEETVQPTVSSLKRTE